MGSAAVSDQAPDPHVTAAAIESVVRLEFAKVTAVLARYTGDVGLAEELAQDAALAALEQWPATGVPRNPGGWLTTVGKRRAIDLFRRNRRLRDRYDELGHDLRAELSAGGGEDGDLDRVISDDIDDDVLRLVFTACHPVLPVEGRVALTLRLLGGLTTAEIARAELVPEPTVAARITRAKKKLAEAGVPFEVPGPDERPARLASVLEVIYLIFNEGYSATAGEDWTRPELCGDALRLARVLVGLMPDEPEVLGLAALIEIQSSRLGARVDADGRPVLLLDQDRRRWDRLLINRGLAALARAEALDQPYGPYRLQAAIASCHAVAFHPDETDWARIAWLYGELAQITPSPIVELNRAVAIAMVDEPEGGPAVALRIVDRLADDPALARYHLLPSVRGDLLQRMSRYDEAAAEFERAAALTGNERERELSLDRASAARDRSTT